MEKLSENNNYNMYNSDANSGYMPERMYEIIFIYIIEERNVHPPREHPNA